MKVKEHSKSNGRLDFAFLVSIPMNPYTLLSNFYQLADTWEFAYLSIFDIISLGISLLGATLLMLSLADILREMFDNFAAYPCVFSLLNYQKQFQLSYYAEQGILL